MSEHIVLPTTAPLPPRPPETVEPSRFQRTMDYCKRVIGRGVLAFSLATGAGAVAGMAGEMLEPHPTAASADTGGYPDWNRPCVAASDPQYGQTEGTGYWCDGYQWGALATGQQNSSRGYGYRNCTDWAAYGALQLTGVVVPHNLS
jgi:hypothetical protein